jgi:hypothetical protein
MHTPYGIREEVRELAIPVLNALLKAGWTVSGIDWDSEIKRTVKFLATLSTGESVFVVCRENDLVNSLQDTLDRSDR